MPRWPGDPQVSFETVAESDVDGFFLRRFAMGEHSGTHVNAALSFQAGGASIADRAAADLVLPGVVIDVATEAGNDADFTLRVEAVQSWEERHGRIPSASLVMLYTGWQQRWSNSEAFLGAQSDGTMHFPGFGLDAATFLLDRRQVRGLGIDTHGIDGGRETGFAVNRLVLGCDGLVIENLNNLDQLPACGSTVVVGVLRLRGGSGSPAAVMGLIP